VRIEAGGKTWIVEQRELARASWAGNDRFSGVTFRNADYDAEGLQVRWVLRPERLTPSLARELFEIAGVRLWRDPRDLSAYRLHLESNTAHSGRVGRPMPLETIRFQSQDTIAEAPWTLDKPLGCASDAELMKLLDDALEDHGRGGLLTD
jgi:hypothetical protein